MRVEITVPTEKSTTVAAFWPGAGVNFQDFQIVEGVLTVLTVDCCIGLGDGQLAVLLGCDVKKTLAATSIAG